MTASAIKTNREKVEAAVS